jgi:hypothetical protein
MIVHNDFQKTLFSVPYKHRSDVFPEVQEKETDPSVDITIWGKKYALYFSEDQTILRREDGTVFSHLPVGAEDVGFTAFKKWGKEYLWYSNDGKQFLVDEQGIQLFPLGVDEIEGAPGMREIGCSFFSYTRQQSPDVPTFSEEEIIRFKNKDKPYILTKEGHVFAVGKKGKLQEDFSLLVSNAPKKHFFGEECTVVTSLTRKDRWQLYFADKKDADQHAKFFPVGEPATSPYFSSLIIPQPDGTQKEYVTFERDGILFDMDKDGNLLDPKGRPPLQTPSLSEKIKEWRDDIKQFIDGY